MKYYATVGYFKVTDETINHLFCGLIRRYKTNYKQFLTTDEAVNFFFESRGNCWLFESLNEAKIHAASMTINDGFSKRQDVTIPIYEIDLPDNVHLQYC